MTRGTPKRIFYGVELVDKDLTICLDALRFLAEPQYYRRSHVTVRGPYERALSKKTLSTINSTFEERFRSVVIGSPISFFFGKQNTVVLPCEIPGIRDVWKKPDYSDGIAHITLYDGKSRRDAEALLYILKKYRWHIIAKTTAIQKLDTKIDPLEDLLHVIHIIQQSPLLKTEVMGEDDLVDISKLSLLGRTIYIDRICHLVQRKFTVKKFGGSFDAEIS